MELVWRYLRLYSHVVTNNRRDPYRRALCGVAPLANTASHDLWQVVPVQEAPRECSLCAMRLAELTQQLTTVPAQEGRSS